MRQHKLLEGGEKGCTCYEYESFAAKACLCYILCFAVKTVTKMVCLKKNHY